MAELNVNIQTSPEKISINTDTGGEPLRIFTSGLPSIEGNTVLEKRRYFMDHYDHLRTGLLREPRGHADMYGAILTHSIDGADFDVFFINTEGYSPMCGHAILAITKVVLETGIIPISGANPELVINTPAGRNYALAKFENDEVRSVSFRNVPSFVYLQNQEVTVPGLREVSFSIAFGGAFYAIVDAGQLHLILTDQHYGNIIQCGRDIKGAILEKFKIEHPFEPDLSSLFGVIFTAPPHDPKHHSRNFTVFEDGVVDRSPTGTGVSARAALHFAKGKLRLGETITIESIIGSTMTVQAVEETTFASYKAIIPEVGGTAHITGLNEAYFDPKDPLSGRFTLR
ncbi:hypothetical protein MMC14_002686 [Varicellaria rhodocarpa]|nr:hypothetical protein [Varicellaria rhodocarpa]